ncbi:hypothetical protein CVT26_007687 [Gymnopilus dilepis]|uniref:Uncharacterized protein n=1 Tax=Gymnopilus dilepis TaxID=231916 RepID=A0A409WSB2_9AGAR|nr:hypothetical protein CVT26_007687 [Gymnopilus dilepis]
MSTSSSPLLPAWEEPREFSLPVPFDHQTDLELLLACSATHVVLGRENNSLIYLYSLPTFNPTDLQFSYLRSLEIYGETLIAVARRYTGYVLYFYDLSTGECLDVVNGGHRCPTVSFPETELVEAEGNGKLVREEWPKHPTLVIFVPGQILRTYRLHRSFKRSTPVINTEGVQESVTMVPEITISLSPNVQCHASMGRTAVTGGDAATVRVWDIITGECRQVLIGHRWGVNAVSLDTAKIYSAATYDGVRVWDRYSGDCLQVLDMESQLNLRLHRLDTTPSYLVGTAGISKAYSAFIWDPNSGMLIHQIDGNGDSCLGPVRGKEHTLVTVELDTNSGKNFLKIWDLNSSQVIMHFPDVPLSTYTGFCSQDRFLMALVTQDAQLTLKVWDFGDNDTPKREDDVSGINDASSEDDLVDVDKTEDSRGIKLADTIIQSSNSSSVEEIPEGGSIITGKRKFNEGESSIRRIFQRLVGGERGVAREGGSDI